jgi:uncharacterized membrane protein (DUF485 family)
MFDLNFLKQKSPQQRFLFILGLAMMLLYVLLGILIIFYFEKLNLDPEKFPEVYRVTFGIVLIIYAIIRFYRVLGKKD